MGRSHAASESPILRLEFVECVTYDKHQACANMQTLSGVSCVNSHFRSLRIPGYDLITTGQICLYVHMFVGK